MQFELVSARSADLRPVLSDCSVCIKQAQDLKLFLPNTPEPKEDDKMSVAAQNPCSQLDNIDQNSALTIRVAGVFAILVSSAVGVWFPWVTSARDLQLTTFLGTVFAAGVVLATGFVHILPDGDNAFKNPCLGFSGTFPWASAIGGGSVLAVFVAEYFLRRLLRRKLGLAATTVLLPHAHGTLTVGEAASSSAAEEGSVGLSEEHSRVTAKGQVIENRVAAVMLECGIVFHSVFVGIDFGINTDVGTARALMIALIFHQGFEGLALGSALVRAQCSRGRFTMLAIVFCLITPFGTALGLGMGSSYNDNDKVSLGFSGAFNSVSGGILIYNGLVDLIVPIFSYNTLLEGRPRLQLLAVFLLFSGYCSMALIAKWA